MGVQELIGQRPCRLEAVADSAVEVLSISHERLQQLPGSEEFSTSLQALVELLLKGLASMANSVGCTAAGRSRTLLSQR